METIDIITGILKRDFDFLTQRGYAFSPLEVFNQNNPARIFARLNAVNEELKRKLVFVIYPRETIELDVYITDAVTGQSLTFKSYVNFKQGNPPRQVPNYLIDKNNIQASTKAFSTYIRSLIEGDLKDVVFGKEWITFPVYDPRDAY